MKNFNASFAAAMMASLTLSGCAAVVKTPYQAPAVQTPTQFQYQTSTHNALDFDRYADQWWTLFQDPVLNNLVSEVISRNSDLALAGLNIRQARLRAGLALDQQGPRVGANASTGHQFDLNAGDNRAQGLSVGANVGYELDLFGRLARQSEAAAWEANATEQDLNATAQSLIATTAQLYWQLAYLHESLSTANLSLATSEQLYQLVNSQYQAGAVSGVELTQAEQAVQGQRANLSQIQQNLVETRTALAVLLNQPVQQLTLQEPHRLPDVQLPQIQAGLPASVIARRPDLRAAELRLRAVLANQDATRASYYPSISLTGNLGASSTSLSELIKNPLLTLGANLSLPFLQYNDMQKNIRISELDYEKAIIQYRQNLYRAFADVENALSARTELAEQLNFQARNLELAERAETLTGVRYQNGAVPLRTLLDQQQITRNARLSLVSAKQNQYLNYVTLIQALGGSPLAISPAS